MVELVQKASGEHKVSLVALETLPWLWGQQNERNR